MRVIITGGTGHVGSRLTQSLAAEGHEVIQLSRDPAARAKPDLPAGARVERWDGRTAEGWGRLIEGTDVVVNLAGESIAGKGLIPARWTPERKRRILESRVSAGQAVTQAITAASQKPKLLIQQSAVGHYGFRGDERLTESASAGDDFLARVTVEWEASTQPVEALGVRRVITRTGLRLLKEPGGFLRPLLLIFNLMAGGPMGSGKQYWPWIHPDDEVRALRFLMADERAAGVYNMTGPEPVTNREFVRTFGKVLGRSAFMPAPGFALRLVLGELAEALILNGQRAVPQHLLDSGFKFNYLTFEAAIRNVLGK
ncbi:MAG: TIGR01777 family oxidoreductase [Anaerolineales bacterium]|nr:TIGR01777 family oxidoreductase [Anaerolineales bacterium]